MGSRGPDGLRVIKDGKQWRVKNRVEHLATFKTRAQGLAYIDILNDIERLWRKFLYERVQA